MHRSLVARRVTIDDADPSRRRGSRKRPGYLATRARFAAAMPGPAHFPVGSRAVRPVADAASVSGSTSPATPSGHGSSAFAAGRSVPGCRSLPCARKGAGKAWDHRPESPGNRRGRRLAGELCAPLRRWLFSWKPPIQRVQSSVCIEKDALQQHISYRNILWAPFGARGALAGGSVSSDGDQFSLITHYRLRMGKKMME